MGPLLFSGVAMNREDFSRLLEERVGKIHAVLKNKAVEYAPGDDRLHNFKRAAKITGETPAQVCVGFMVKHLVSVLDIVDGLSKRNSIRMEIVDEKIGDAINYLILLEALIKE